MANLMHDDESAAAAIDSSIPQLMPELHGRGCLRGELYLSDAESLLLQPIVEKWGFQFAQESFPGKEIVTGGRKSVQTVQGSGKGRAMRGDDVGEATPKPQPRRASAVGSGGRQRRRLDSSGRVKRRSLKSDEGYATESSQSDFSDEETKGGASGVGTRRSSVGRDNSRSPLPGSSSNIGLPIPTRQSRRKRRAFTGRWEDNCKEVQAKLEAEGSAQWFRLPVDPDNDGVPDYLEMTPTPMDLQTVRQKLDQGMYTHPYRWQHDVRTIFANAFRYHPPGNPIWKDAHALASRFEALCKEYESVNPYAVYCQSPTGAPQSDANDGTPAVDNTITIGTTELLQLLEKAAASFQKPETDADFHLGDDAAYASPFYPSNTHTEATLGPATLPPPPDAPVASVPNRVTDKPLNQIQKRTTASMFRELDVHYRKAALDVVRTELGVHPILSALDIRYIPDTDVLPIPKQKQFLHYIKTLEGTQRRHVTSGFLPTLATHIAATAPAPQPSPSPPPQPQPVPYGLPPAAAQQQMMGLRYGPPGQAVAQTTAASYGTPAPPMPHIHAGIGKNVAPPGPEAYYGPHAYSPHAPPVSMPVPGAVSDSSSSTSSSDEAEGTAGGGLASTSSSDDDEEEMGDDDDDEVPDPTPPMLPTLSRRIAPDETLAAQRPFGRGKEQISAPPPPSSRGSEEMSVRQPTGTLFRPHHCGGKTGLRPVGSVAVTSLVSGVGVGGVKLEANSAWSEWKSKVIQNSVLSSTSAPAATQKGSDRERLAEQRDAEI